MNESLLERLVALLVEIRRVGIGPRARITEFQRLVWDAEEPISANPEVAVVLKDLAYDLDYCEARPSARREEPSYYGDKRLSEELESVLQRLSELGVAVPLARTHEVPPESNAE